MTAKGVKLNPPLFFITEWTRDRGFWIADLRGISRIARILVLDRGFYGDFADCADFGLLK